MQKRTKIILIIITALLLFLIVGIIFVLLNQKIIRVPVIKKPAEEKKVEESKLPAAEETLRQAQGLTPKQTQDLQELEIKRLASFFAERYGSYSNQAPFQNLIELKPFMTKKMQAWADELMRESQENMDTYHGFITKAISSEIVGIDSVEARVLVQTQRQEATGTTDNTRVFYQEIEVEMVKADGEWKANEVQWK
jgi:hypothetical protein